MIKGVHAMFYTSHADEMRAFFRDMLMLDDIARLWELRDDRYAVMVVKHDHVPRETVKFLGEPQSKYEKKNWSSVMLFNNARCAALTPQYVSSASGLELHQFKWLEDEAHPSCQAGQLTILVSSQTKYFTEVCDDGSTVTSRVRITGGHEEEAENGVTTLDRDYLRVQIQSGCTGIIQVTTNDADFTWSPSLQTASGCRLNV